MIYDLKFKKEEREQGYWHINISAENEEEAIQIAKEKLKTENYKKAELVQTVYKEKVIYKF